MNEISHKLVRQILNHKFSKPSDIEPVFQELAARVSSRLDYIRINPQTVLDCGSGYGIDLKLLEARYPQAQIIALDSCFKFLQDLRPPVSITARLAQVFGRKNANSDFICSDASVLPLRSGSIDLVYSNLLLPYLNDYRQFFAEISRVLKVGGTFCFSGLGVDSAKELRALGLSTYTFPDMHDIGDSLLAAGFSNPVVDTEYLTLDYDSLEVLLMDAQNIGCGAAINLPPLSAEIIANLRSQRKKLPAQLTLELFVAHGWKDKVSFSDREVIQFMPKSAR